MEHSEAANASQMQRNQRSDSLMSASGFFQPSPSRFFPKAVFIQSLEFEQVPRGFAQLSLGIFQELYQAVQKILDLPDLAPQPELITYGDNTVAINWWTNLLYQLDKNIFSEHIKIAEDKYQGELHKEFISGDLKFFKTLPLKIREIEKLLDPSLLEPSASEVVLLDKDSFCKSQNQTLKSQLADTKKELKQLQIRYEELEKELVEREKEFNEVIFTTQTKCRQLETQLEEGYSLFRTQRLTLISQKSLEDYGTTRLNQIEKEVTSVLKEKLQDPKGYTNIQELNNAYFLEAFKGKLVSANELRTHFSINTGFCKDLCNEDKKVSQEYGLFDCRRIILGCGHSSVHVQCFFTQIIFNNKVQSLCPVADKQECKKHTFSAFQGGHAPLHYFAKEDYLAMIDALFESQTLREMLIQ